MSHPKTLWLLPIGILVVLSFILPFTVFRDIDAWYGSFLFWTLSTVAVIVISAIISADWKD